MLFRSLAAIAKQEEFGEAEIASRTMALTNKVMELATDETIDLAVARYLRRRIDRSLKNLNFSSPKTTAEISADYATQTGSIDIAGLVF